MSGLEPRTVALHGRAVSYVQAGSGPVLLLIHRIAGSVENWQEVIEPLAQRHTVVAAILRGHVRAAAMTSANLELGPGFPGPLLLLRVFGIRDGVAYRCCGALKAGFSGHFEYWPRPVR